MIASVYDWIGLGVGGIAVVLASSALIQEMGGSRDFGSIAFELIFGIFWAGVAASSGYALLHSRRLDVSGGCLLFTTVTGAMVLLTGGFLAALTIDSVEPPDHLLVGILLCIGAVILVPSAMLLWHRRDRGAQSKNVRKWQGVVAGGLVVFLGAFMFVATSGDPYDVGPVGRVSIAVVMALGAIVAGGCSLLLWRGRRPTAG